jgi:hypothetical protein
MNKNMETLIDWVRRRISLVAFVTGFIWDTLTLKRIDLIYENVVFVSYLVIAFVGIVLIHSVEMGRFRPKLIMKYREWLPALIQFPLGGLFSGFVIFYTKSGSLFTSWPFLLILIGLFIGNEFFRKRYERLVFQISVFYFALLTYLVLIIPAVLHTLSTSTFIFAGLLSLIAIVLIVQLIAKLFPKLYRQGSRALWTMIILIYVGFNALYFSNIIPPVPLALKEVGMYHSVVRTVDGYAVTYQTPKWYEVWRSTSHTFYRAPGEAAYCFSSVFAPTELRTKIYHSWQWQTESGSWKREERIPFTIEGGRDGGYRGFTLKEQLNEGTWRCVVETDNGQVIGHTSFTVVNVGEQVPLARDVR